jgi:phosphoglycerol transferase MdoB-like AlkP superfamily enzyme
MGFESFYGIDEMELKEYGWGARDSDVFSFVSSFINNHNKPYFNHIITMSSHGPFRNVGLYYENSRFDDLPEKSIDRAYFTAMAYVDSSLEDFFINSSMDLINTILFIYGDHTEYYSTDSEAHRAFYVDGALKLEFVPLIIVGEGENWEPGINRWAASFLDIGPTALAASGITYNIQTEGIDLLSVDSSHQKSEIPFNGISFNRNELFLMAEGTK